MAGAGIGVKMLTAEEREELSGYDYPFENVAFEGGGNKGSAYIGAIRVLEEIGVWQNIRRISGASIGAITAAWAAVGYTSNEIETMCDTDLKRICHDAKFGLMNLARSYGWHPGDRLHKWLGKTLDQKTGDADLTFFELYRRFGTELCITTTNLNQLDCVYCHVKTTPDLPIRTAIRMSLSIPGVFTPVKYDLNAGATSHLFVDGGLLCNYPVQVFDGWFLSMEPEDSFLKRIPRNQGLSQSWEIHERFGGQERNEKTVGMLLYSDDEQELMKLELEKREQKHVKKSTDFPDTALTRKRKTMIARRKKYVEDTDNLTEAMETFLKACSDCDFDCSGTVSKEELKTVLNAENGYMTQSQIEMLFGKDFTIDELFKRLDKDESGDLSFQELVLFAENRGVALMSYFCGFNSRPINSLGDYFNAIMDSLMINIKRLVVNSGDLERTIGINTKYLDTLDFDLEAKDKLFLVEQGKLGCIAFLRYYIETKKPPKKGDHLVKKRSNRQCQSMHVKPSARLSSSSSDKGMANDVLEGTDVINEEPSEEDTTSVKGMDNRKVNGVLEGNDVINGEEHSSGKEDNTSSDMTLAQKTIKAESVETEDLEGAKVNGENGVVVSPPSDQNLNDRPSSDHNGKASSDEQTNKDLTQSTDQEDVQKVNGTL